MGCYGNVEVTAMSELHNVFDVSSNPPCHREYRRRQGRYAKSKLQKTVSFVETEPLNVHQSTITHTHTHTHTHILLAALIFPK
jgi:hypothetical protein